MKREIHELDSTSVGTGLKNFVSRQKNALQGALGSPDAIGRHDVRLITNQLYRNWRTHVGAQGLDGTDRELTQFIYRHYGGNPAVMPTLKQQFPKEFATASVPAQTAAGGTPAAPNGGTPAPSGGTTPPSGGAPAAGSTPAGSTSAPAATPEISDHDSYVRLGNFRKRIKGHLDQGMRSGKPDANKIMRSVNSMIRSFGDARRSDKARQWAKDYIDQSLRPHAEIVPQLGQIPADPFANIPQRRTPVPSIPKPPPTPRSVSPDMSQPPEFLRRQQNPPSNEPPKPRDPMTVPAYKQPTRQPANMEYPPAFMRRQRSEPDPPQIAANPTQRMSSRLGRARPRLPRGDVPPNIPVNVSSGGQAKVQGESRRPLGRLIERKPASSATTDTVLKRSQVDAIFVALARILMDAGEASVNRPNRRSQPAAVAGSAGTQNQQANAQQQQPSQRSQYGGPSIMATRITPDALNTAVGTIKLSDSETGQLQQIIANQPTLSDILNTSHVALSNKMTAALIHAAEATAG